MLKIKIIEWPLQTENNEYKGQYIIINPIYIMYITPYDYNIKNGMYKLTMYNSSDFLIEQSSLDKILACKGEDIK